MFILSKFIKNLSFVLAVLVISWALSYSVLAWTEPGSTPPGGNVDTPINTGLTGQIKSGNLQVNALSIAAFGNALLVPNGNVGIGTTMPRTSLELGNDGAILAIGTFGSGWIEPSLGAGTRMLWYPKKAAFRAGGVSGSQWDDANIGFYSTAFGTDSVASQIGSVAMGVRAIASGTNASIALGEDALASGAYGVALGKRATAGGDYSTAVGRGARAMGTSSVTVAGAADDSFSLINNTAFSLMIGFQSDIPTLFVGPSAGTGTTGNVGIGTITPSEKLEVNGNIKATAFLYSSDERLKENIFQIENPLEKILKLNGVSFNWKNSGEKGIGLTAQNVETVFPELVKTDGATGMKSVEYGNLVAPLIEAIKQQQKMIENQQKEIDALKAEINK